MKRFWCLLGILVLLAVILEVNEAAPEPKRRSGGGSRSKSKGSSGGLFGSLFGGSKKKPAGKIQTVNKVQRTYRGSDL